MDWVGWVGSWQVGRWVGMCRLPASVQLGGWVGSTSTQSGLSRNPTTRTVSGTTAFGGHGADGGRVGLE